MSYITFVIFCIISAYIETVKPTPGVTEIALCNCTPVSEIDEIWRVTLPIGVPVNR